MVRFTVRATTRTSMGEINEQDPSYGAGDHCSARPDPARRRPRRERGCLDAAQVRQLHRAQQGVPPRSWQAERPRPHQRYPRDQFQEVAGLVQQELRVRPRQGRHRLREGLTRGLAAATLLGVALVASGCSHDVDPDAPVPTVHLGSAASAGRDLRTLPTGERNPRLPTYVRAAFGDSWIDTDGNGCNQRDDVLLRDAVPDTVTVAQQGS